MPCIIEETRDIDVALQILDVVTPRINITMNSGIRETTQTDHINKHLLKAFLERISVMPEVAENKEDDNQEFNV